MVAPVGSTTTPATSAVFICENAATAERKSNAAADAAAQNRFPSLRKDSAMSGTGTHGERPWRRIVAWLGLMASLRSDVAIFPGGDSAAEEFTLAGAGLSRNLRFNFSGPMIYK